MPERKRFVSDDELKSGRPVRIKGAIDLEEIVDDGTRSPCQQLLSVNKIVLPSLVESIDEMHPEIQAIILDQMTSQNQVNY